MRALPVLLLLLAACMKAPQPPAALGAPSDPHAGLAMPQASPPAAAPSGELSFAMEAPAGWTEVPPDMAFYLAKWTLPGDGGGVCTVSADVGPIDMNLPRWYGQWQVPGGSAEASAEHNRLPETRYPTRTVVVRGTLAETRQVGGGPPRADWMLAGAIIEHPQGPIFVKAVGPQAVLEPQLEELWRAVANAKISP